jgi:hypothetical protein
VITEAWRARESRVGVISEAWRGRLGVIAVPVGARAAGAALIAEAGAIVGGEPGLA